MSQAADAQWPVDVGLARKGPGWPPGRLAVCLVFLVEWSGVWKDA